MCTLEPVLTGYKPVMLKSPCVYRGRGGGGTEIAVCSLYFPNGEFFDQKVIIIMIMIMIIIMTLLSCQLHLAVGNPHC